MADSIKCPHCGNWIGPMQVHKDCARKQDEKRRKQEDGWTPTGMKGVVGKPTR